MSAGAGAATRATAAPACPTKGCARAARPSVPAGATAPAGASRAATSAPTTPACSARRAPRPATAKTKTATASMTTAPAAHGPTAPRNAAAGVARTPAAIRVTANAAASASRRAASAGAAARSARERRPVWRECVGRAAGMNAPRGPWNVSVCRTIGVVVVTETAVGYGVASGANSEAAQVVSGAASQMVKYCARGQEGEKPLDFRDLSDCSPRNL